jgi:hypothetical protein
MSDTPLDVMGIKSPIEGDGFPIIPEQGGHGLFKTAVTHPLFLTDFNHTGSPNTQGAFAAI